MKKILLATTLMAATAFSANADASNAFNGSYFGAHAGFVHSKTKIFNRTKSSNGFLLGAYGGYGQNMNGFYIGGEMSISDDTSKRSFTATRNDSEIDYSSTIKYKRGIALGLAPRFGIIFAENLIYIKPGIEISRDKASFNYTLTAKKASLFYGKSYATGEVDTLAASGRKTSVAFTPAFGYERAMGNIFFRGEYTYNPGKVIAVKSNNGTEAAKISYRDHRLSIGAAYKF